MKNGNLDFFICLLKSKFKFGFENRFLFQKSFFFQKLYFQSKIEIFQNFYFQKLNFQSKIEIFKIIFQKLYFQSKIEIFLSVRIEISNFKNQYTVYFWHFFCRLASHLATFQMRDFHKYFLLLTVLFRNGPSYVNILDELCIKYTLSILSAYFTTIFNNHIIVSNII